jgi:hypothetical protein
MRNSRTFVSILTSLALAACTGGADDGGGDDTQVEGQAVYRDATTDHSGAERAPAAPPSQDIEVDVRVEGTGTIPNPDTQCALDPAGAFEAVFSGTATVDESGAYVGALGAASGTIATPSGCEIPDLTVGVFTDVVIRARIEATTANCETYCAASARADAEGECGADADAAACRADAEVEAQASCMTTCTTESSYIVAEAAIGASAIGEIDADALYAAALGELHADLVFDHVE